MELKIEIIGDNFFNLYLIMVYLEVIVTLSLIVQISMSLFFIGILVDEYNPPPMTDEAKRMYS